MVKLNVIGLGYIGLPTALMFAKSGVQVVGTDINQDNITKLNNGDLDFRENGFEEKFEVAKKNNISFSSKPTEAEVYIIAVSTPYIKATKKVDVTYVVSAIQSVLNVSPEGATIVIESTISPGTIDKHIRPIIDSFVKASGRCIFLAHAPERIIPGNMFYELEHNARVIGVDSVEIGEKLKRLYATFCKGEIVITDVKTAEMSKVVENTYRDINIAFANELTKICREGNMNVYEVIKVANMHPRVNILQPGPGVGGHCISVDPWFLVGDYPGLANIILAARKINDSMPEYVLERVYEIMEEHGINDVSRVGFYGLTYKEDVDDMRESPTLQLIDKMKKHLATSPKVYDPMIREIVAENQYLEFDKFIDSIDILVLMVAHMQIKDNIDKLTGKIILDTKEIITREINEDVYFL